MNKSDYYDRRYPDEPWKAEYLKNLKPIELKPAPPDPTIPVICGPSPLCPQCREMMILVRPWHDEKFYREYWRCISTVECKKAKIRLQIDDDGYPIIPQSQKRMNI